MASPATRLRPWRHGVVGAILAVAAPPLLARAPEVSAIPVAKLDVIDGKVEHSGVGRSWRRVEAGFRLRTGDEIRTGPDSLARIDFPFMSIVVGASSAFSIAPSQVLSTALRQGRVEQIAEGSEAIKLRTPEAEVRGGGRVVVRREDGTTRVAVLEGRFRVEAAGVALSIQQGQGTIVRPKAPPAPPVDLPAAPVSLVPGVDPVYVIRGQPAQLSWASDGSAHHVQILGLGENEILMDRDVGRSPVPLEIPWLGTFRWRVSVLDPRGLEGPPSAEGVVCVVEK